MARAYASTVIDQDLDVVWSVLREFDCVGRWIPGVVSCDIVAGESPTNPGRRIVLQDGSSLDERLVTLDEPDHRVRYTILGEHPRGMRAYIGTAALRPVTDTNRTFLEWISEFDCDAAIEARMVAGVTRQLGRILDAAAAELRRPAL